MPKKDEKLVPPQTEWLQAFAHAFGAELHASRLEAVLKKLHPLQPESLPDAVSDKEGPPDGEGQSSGTEAEISNL